MVTDQGDWICEQDGEAGTVMYLRMPSGEDNLVNAILNDEYHDIVLSSGGPGFHCSSGSQALLRRQESEPPVPDFDIVCHTYEGVLPDTTEYHIAIGLPWDPESSCRNVFEKARLSNKWYDVECDEAGYGETRWLLLTHVDDDAEWFMRILGEEYPDVVKHRNGQHFTCPTQPDRAIARRQVDDPVIQPLDMTCRTAEAYPPNEVVYYVTIGVPYESYRKSCRGVNDRLKASGKWFASMCQPSMIMPFDNLNQTEWQVRTYAGNVEWLNKIFDQQYPEVVQHRSGRGFDCHTQLDDAIARRELEEPPINNLEMTCHASPGGFGDYGLLHYTVHIGVKYVSIPSVFPDHPSYNAPSCRNLFMRLHTTGAAFKGFLCHDDGHGATLWHFDADGGSSGTINRLLNEEYPEVVKHMRKKHLGNGFNCPSQADQ